MWKPDRQTNHFFKKFKYALISRVTGIGCILFLLVGHVFSQKTDTLVFGSDANYPPYEYLNKQGRPAGFNVDLIRAIAREINRPLKIKLGNWAAIRREFEQDSSIHITDMYQVPENLAVGEFTSPFEITTTNIYIRKNTAGITKLNDLVGKKVSVQMDNSIHRKLTKENSGIIFLQKASEPEALNALVNNECDAAILTNQLFNQLQKEKRLSNVVTISEPLLYQAYGFIVKKGQLQLQQEINDAIFRIKASGEFDRLRYNWFLKENFWSRNAEMIITGLFILALSVGMFIFLLRKRIREKTKQLKKTMEEQTAHRFNLRQSEEKYRVLAETSTDYIMRYDKEGRHTYMNKAALEISGLTEADIIGKTHREAGFDPELSDLWESRIQQVFKTGQPLSETFSWEGISGPVFLNWKLTPELDEKGNVRSVLGVSRDVTVIKQSELQAKEINQMLEEKVKTRTVDLEQANKELAEINELFLGREARILELKDELRKMKNRTDIK